VTFVECVVIALVQEVDHLIEMIEIVARRENDLAGSLHWM